MEGTRKLMGGGIRRKLSMLVAMIVVMAGTSPLSGGQIELIRPGTLPGQLNSEARDVSGDGRVVVGVSGNRLFRWDGEDLQDIGYVNRGNRRLNDITSISVSNDGEEMLASAPGSRSGLYRWESGGWKDMIRETHSYRSSTISGDGQTILFNKRGQAYRWRDGDYQRLPMATEFHIMVANASSDSGDVVVGFALDRWQNRSYIGNRILVTEAALWRDGEVISLKYPPQLNSSLAKAVSADGKFIAGDAYLSTFDLERVNYTACLWEVGKVMTLPPPPAPKAYSSAADVSDDGSIVVGRIGIGDPPVLKSNRVTEPHDAESRACLWSVYNHWWPVDLNELLDANGVERNGFVLQRATAISADGSTIVGYGVGSGSRREAFILHMRDSSMLPLAGLR